MVDYSGNAAVNQSPLRLMAFATANRGQMQRLIKSGCGFDHTEQHWLNLPEDLGESRDNRQTPSINKQCSTNLSLIAK
jgi:hypothetical protein